MRFGPYAFLPKLPILKGQIEEEALDRFEIYLQELINDAFVRQNTVALYEFLEISLVNMEAGVRKFKEGTIKKRSGGRYKENKWMVYCGNICRRWMMRWFVICQDGVLYTVSSIQPKIREMLLFDNSFKLLYGRRETGSEKGIMLLTPTRTLCLKAYSLFEAVDWLYAIDEAKRSCPYIENNRFMSFAPVRPPNAYCKYFIDGENYFGELCDYLLKAEREVFITDWWLSPEFHLKRPVGPQLNQEFRLDRVLAKIASKGVKVYVILYKEMSFALSNNSRYTKKVLEGLHPNIEVLLHPGYYFFMWSHHEKMVVIDQKIGFTGGLDLCYGRMDNSRHDLVDNDWHTDNSTSYWPKIDYYNVRIRDFINVQDHMQELIDRANTPRMPWHDVALMVIGEVVKDMSRHFIQYWNFVKTDTAPKDKQYFLQPLSKSENEENAVVHIGDHEMVIEEKKTVKQKIKKFIDNIKPIELFKPKRPRVTSESEMKLQPLTNNTPNKLWATHNGELIVDSGAFDSDLKSELQAPLLRTTVGTTTGFNKESKDPRLDAYIERRKNHEDVNRDSFVDPEGEEEKINYSLNDFEKASAKFMFEQNPPIKESLESDLQEEEEKQIGSLSKSQVIPRKINLELETPKSASSLMKTPKRVHGFEIFNPQQDEKQSQKPFRKLPRSTTSSDIFRYSKMDPDLVTIQSDSPRQLRNTDVTHKSDIGDTHERKKSRSPTQNQTKDDEFVEILRKIQREKQIAAKQEPDFFVSREPDSPNSFKTQLEKYFKKRKKEIASRSKKMWNKLKESSDEFYTRNLLKLDVRSKKSKQGTCRCQLLRSASNWSMGLRNELEESSIHFAYLEMILQAKHFIYIENQFFISNSAGDRFVHNQIAEALITRIKKAALLKEKFRVVVFLPMLPGFEGELLNSNSGILKIQMHWQYSTISRGGTSILETLRNDRNIPDPNEYISFFSLRQHSKLNGTPATELIYIHSKLMIVDDRQVIIGSANINDRSLMGNRDSELAVIRLQMIIEDKKHTYSSMNYRKFEVTEFAHQFRCDLYQEHFGLPLEEVIDPINDDFWDEIHSIAKVKLVFKTLLIIRKKNTEIYREIFAVYPDDTISSFVELQEFMQHKKLELYEEKSSEIVGHAVQFPLKFLSNENLCFSVFSKEYYLPNHNFT